MVATVPATRPTHASPAKPRAWRASFSGPWIVVLGLPMIALYGLLVFVPGVELVRSAISGGTEGIAALFRGPGLRAVTTTISLSLVVTLLVLVIGGVMAWTLRSSRSRVTSILFWTALLAPLSMSVVVKNFSFVTILGRFGILNWLTSHLGLGTHDILYTPTAVTIGMVYSLLPYGALPLFVTFKTIPEQVLRAARSLGARDWEVAKTVVAPIALPGIFTTGVLVFILSIGFFVTPVILGGPRSTFLASLIQNDIQQNFDQSAAAVKALFLIAVAVALIVISVLIVGRRRLEQALGA
jgi:putative spermidine/putrescine transport system permease protein